VRTIPCIPPGAFCIQEALNLSNHLIPLDFGLWHPFDLVHDPAQSVNDVIRYSEVVDRMQQRLRQPDATVNAKETSIDSGDG